MHRRFTCSTGVAVELAAAGTAATDNTRNFHTNDGRTNVKYKWQLIVNHIISATYTLRLSHTAPGLPAYHAPRFITQKKVPLARLIVF